MKSVTCNFISRWLGRQSYDAGLRLQEELVAQKIAGDKKNYLLLLEHEPVYTIGRTHDRTSLGTMPLPHPLHQIGRGGQATYHGPGQLVCYPILDLHLFNRDLHHYLRFLEAVIISLLEQYSLVAEQREGLTGVWIGHRKIASLGVGVRKWISFHGLALNVSGDLAPFQSITPCGLADVEMTSLEREVQRSDKSFLAPEIEKVAQQLSALFLEKISLEC